MKEGIYSNMNSKLILVEGLPGSGKTTTARLVHEILTQNNFDVELFLEGNLDHPADYDGVSFFTEYEFHQLLSKSGQYKELLLETVTEKGGQFFLPYRKIMNEYGNQFQQFPDELLTTIFKKDLYELPFEQNRDLIIQKWEEFATKATNENKTYIFECCLIQNPITIGMIKYGVTEEKIIDYVMRLKKTIETLNPVLFYIEQEDLESSFKKAVNERPKIWSEGFIEYYTRQGYGKQHSYEGLDGTIQVLRARRELELKILDHLDLKKVKLNYSH